MKICGYNLPSNKRLEIALTYIKGIGRTTSKKIMKDLKFSTSVRVKDAEEKAQTIQEYINVNDIITGDAVTNLVNANIRTKINLRRYQGYRHERNLPVRGQQTKRNAKTRKNSKSVLKTIKKTIRGR